MSDFDRAFEIIVGAEGGYVNDPKDPGGETKYGVCKRSYPDLDIKNLTLGQAKAIYKRDFWDAVKGDQLPSKLNILVFDSAVNQGVGAAAKMLQAALGVAQDGILGRDTMTAIAKRDLTETCAMFMAGRALRYTGTRNFDLYGKGWFKRLFAVTMEV